VDHIDILSVDVEGWELEVIAGLDLEKFKPRVMIIENLFGDPQYQLYLERQGLFVVDVPLSQRRVCV